MYEELVRDLRYCAQCTGPLDCDGCQWRGTTYNNVRDKDGAILGCEEQMKLEAADAIEELSAFREHITDGHFYCMRDGVLYEAKVEPPKGKVFQLPPMVFVEEGET